MTLWNANQSHWNLSLLRSPSDWEEESGCNLLALLADKNVVPQANDEIVWPHGTKGFGSQGHLDVQCSAKACFLFAQPPKIEFPQRKYVEE